MIKKLLLAGIVLAAGFSASAGTYTVYQNGQLGANLNPSDWWNGSFNFTAASPDGEDVKIFEFKPAGGANGYANASMGIQMVKPGNTGSLHSATLNFKYYAQGTGTYTIRLTGKGQVETEEYKFNVTDDDAGKWNEISYVVKEQQPTIAQQWVEDANYGEGFVFSVILTDGVENSVIYFNDIEYTNTDDAWVAPDHGVTAPTTVPMPEKSAEEILSFLTPYGKVTYGVPGWGQSTQYSLTSIDGKDVIHLNNFNYQGLDAFDIDISGYTHMHVDFWTHNGNTFSFCPISLDPTTVDNPRWFAPEVKQGEWNNYDAPLSSFNANLNLNSIKQLKFDDGAGCEAYIANIYFWKDENAGGEEPEQPEQPGEKGATYYGSLTGNFNDTPFTMTYSATWNENGTVTFNANINPTVDGLVAQLFANGAYLADFANQGNGNFTLTTTAAYEAGTKPFAFYAAFAGGNTGVIELDYVVGSSNDAPEQPEPDQPTEPEEGNNAVWYGQTDIEGFSADWNIKFNTDRTLTFSAEMFVEKTVGVNERNVHIFGSIDNSDEWVKLYDNDGTGIYTGTTTGLFVLDKEVSWEWYLPVEGGDVYKQTNKYIVGSSNEAPKSIRIKASVENITANSAEIAYEVTAPEGYTVTVTYRTENGEAVTATESPIRLSELSENTQYTYILSATAVKDDVTLTSKDIKVTFKTLRAGARDYVYADLFKAEFKNAYRVGEPESYKRTIYTTLPWQVTYTANGEAIFSVDMSSVADIVGLVPAIWVGGPFYDLEKVEGTDIYQYNMGEKEFGKEAQISHYYKYADATVDVRTNYTVWGQEQEAFELGEPTAITLTASQNVVKVNDPIIIYAVPTDADGYYLPADDVEITVAGGPYAFNDIFLTLIEMKGERTVTASVGEVSTSITVNAIASPEAQDLIAGTKGITDEENIMENTLVENVTDNDPGTELRWSCANTQEHYLIYDLGFEGKYIEAIDLLFEGAWATQFTITLTNNAPEELGNELSTLAAATEDVVFQPERENDQHYFTQDPEESHRYVVLRTTQARNSGWGIKIKDMKVYGTYQAPTTTGVDEIAIDENAPVEYYNLQGVRVENPANGLYIRRQGKVVTKVLVK